MTPVPIQVLLIEDQRADARLFARHMEVADAGAFVLTHVESLEHAFEHLGRATVDVVVLDLGLPEASGLDTLHLFKAKAPDTPLVVLTGMDDRQLAIQVVQEGAQDFLFKGLINPEQLVRMLYHAIERQQRERYLKELEASEVRFRRMIESNMDAILLVDQEGIVHFGNAMASTLLGRDIADLVNAPFGFPMVEGDAAELNILHPAQETVYVEMRATEIHWKGMDVYLVSLRDVTTRKKVEQERERLIADLEAKNAELERFTYTVSHDLKSPLVTVGGLVGLLEHHAKAGEIKELEEDIDYIRDAILQMDRLLTELLNLSRVGRLVNPPERVPLTELVREAINLVAGEIAERGVDVEIVSAMPIVFVDRLRLREVFQNLIENAVKYMDDQPNPRIEIGCRLEEEKPVIYVRDNGRGINPKYHAKVFNLFERLDADDKGAGVGLALVKRIVEVYEGRIWIESDGEGHGSTFCFTVPVLEE